MVYNNEFQIKENNIWVASLNRTKQGILSTLFDHVYVYFCTMWEVKEPVEMQWHFRNQVKH